MPRRLLALDLDGTLLRADGSVDPRDADAIARARTQGVAVSLATGRMASGSLPTARALDLVDPLVCADGGAIVDARTGARIESRPIPIDVVHAMLECLGAMSLSRFLFGHDEIHGDDHGEPYVEYVRTWAGTVTLHARLAHAPGWRETGEIAAAAAIGSRDDVRAAIETIHEAHGVHVEGVVFPARHPTGNWAALIRPKGTHKGAALERLAARLDVPREHVAAVGDWHNDVTMLRWAGRSFAMGQAPEAVKEAATDRLQRTTFDGGGVAEAIERWLDGDEPANG